MSSDLESRFHTEWLGLVQPVEGLVVSVPVLTDAQCMRRQPLALHQRFVALTSPPAAARPLSINGEGAPRNRTASPSAASDRSPSPFMERGGAVARGEVLFNEILDWTPDLYDTGPALPDDLALYVPEGHQTLRPTLALRHRAAPESTPSFTDDSTPASRAGADYVALLWDLLPGLPLDKPETTTGPWDYPPAAKFDRLLRACRVPIGVLTNGQEIRLVYAPHGESSGHITFRVEDMAAVAGRTLFDAFVMLLSAERFFGVAPEHQLPALLRDSRTRQANVTNELAEQMLDAIHVLLAGFVAAAERDKSKLLDQALERDDDHVYQGLLTVLLRLVFALYAEDRALLPVDHPDYAQHLSVLGLFAQLQRDHGEWPDSMGRRFGAWARLVALFRAIFLGMRHGTLVMPARRGELFDPHRFPFLEGWGPAGAAPLVDHDEMGRVRVPTVDDATVYTVLHRLLLFQGQRLSYRALDVEQIGAVYEALMGFHVVRLPGPALCLKGSKGAKVWVVAADVLAQSPAQRAAWVADTAALAKSAVAKVADALKAAQTETDVLAALQPLRVKGSDAGRAGQLVVQPGNERRRTSSHYTPPSLTAPIVRRTLEPLLAAMGPEPSAERLLQLKICDPAMGSGAFLVEACRFLADQVVAAWTRTSPPSPLSMNGEGEFGGEAAGVEGEFGGAAGAGAGTGAGVAEGEQEGEGRVVVRVTGGVEFLDPMKLERARALRQSPTPAAQRAWELLRGRKMLGLKFRREQVIEGFIADFYCPALGLVVEVDGSVHDDPEQAEYDTARSACFAALGLRVARIRNQDVSQSNLEALLRPLLTPSTPAAAPPNSPSPFMERGLGGEVDPVLLARRLVAQRCLYGVDKNPLAVSLARLSLWLVTLARDEPFTFVDHALRHGDALVGLDLDQIRAFHWKPGAQTELAKELIDTALDEALAARQRILALAPGDDTRAKEHLLWDANDALAPVRLLGDLVVGAFFTETKDKAREAERTRRLDLVVQWLESRREPPEALLAMQRDLRARVPAFHWGVEFPEVFYGERPDPLDGDRVNRVAWMDAFVGNPPFAGKNGITDSNTDGYIDWLMAMHPEVEGHPNVDLCGYFFRRAAYLLGRNGSLGLVATNTVSQGDTRLIALKWITDLGGRIFEAATNMSWPGDAAVSVSIVHIALGEVASLIEWGRLNGHRVNAIDSRLCAGAERPEAKPLRTNADLSFMGGKLVGEGLSLWRAECEALILKNADNAKILRPYLGGEELNQSPPGPPSRFVIDFSDNTLEEARNWPDLLEIAEQRVRPDREKNKRQTYKTYWWKPGESGRALYAALVGIERCLVAAIVTKHLSFSFRPTTIFFGQALYVFPLHRYTSFSILQSRVHEPWARLLSSSLEDRLRYAASDCFSTFPFPQPDPRAVIPALEDVGERLYTARAAFMVETQQGLTQTYNALKDARVNDARVVTLRRLHEEMDRAVLAAYGWDDLEVPVYGTATTEAEKQVLSRFEDAVIDRLFALNATRAEAERVAAAQQVATGPAKTKGGRKKGGAGSGQGTLGIG